MEHDTEDVYEYVIQLATSLHIKADKRDISAAKRLGRNKRQDNRPRPILVCFLYVSLRDELMKRKARLKHCPGYEKVWVNADEPKEIRRNKGKLRKVAYMARKVNATVKVGRDSITIDGKLYTIDRLEQIPTKYTQVPPNSATLQTTPTTSIPVTEVTQNKAQGGARPKTTPTNPFYKNNRSEVVANIRETPSGIVFAGQSAYLSNFYPCDMEYNGITYSCAEQAYQHTKAKVAGDENTAAQILNVTNPLQIKRLGDKVKAGPEWIKLRLDQLQRINRAKYTQHHDLARKLKATHPTPLIEGTIDSLWGGGLHFDSVGYDENDFHGKNAFGSILADVRADLLQRR